MTIRHGRVFWARESGTDASDLDALFDQHHLTFQRAICIEELEHPIDRRLLHREHRGFRALIYHDVNLDSPRPHVP